MSYQVLARKWRPRNFQDMVGQTPILRMLENALLQKRLHHAYLFTGTRGVGKTTLARILAKCLNCEIGVTNAPCGNCSACVAIDKGQFLDLFEVDAASRTKVEDTRDLLENVLYPPTQGRYKIYLIDEVHMLSNHSFNALLKTLEEPPEHVKFLLATTEPKRLPITILSRCLQFHLKRISVEHIAGHLTHICVTESISHEQEALNKLAIAADGSLRDALSLLDQAIAYGHGNVTTQEVNAMLGSMAQDDILPLLDALAEQDGKKLFATINELAEGAPDFQQILEELISLLHKIAIAQVVPEINQFSNPLVESFTPETIQLYYQIALLGRRDLSLAPSLKQGFEMTMLRMLAFKPGSIVTNNTPSDSTVSQIKNKPSVAQPTVQKMAPVTTDLATVDWRELLPKLKLSGMALALAENCTLVKIENNKIELAISIHHEAMLNQKLKERMVDALGRHFQKEIQLEIKVSTTDLFTPVKQQRLEQEEHLAKAKQTIMDDPRVKQLIETYDATVEVSLLS